LRGWRPPLPFAVGVVCFGSLGFFEGPLGDARPVAPELRAALRLVVTSGADSGPGSLREAILAADRSPQRARIELRVARIQLLSALPPLVGQGGVTIDAPEPPAVIDGGSVTEGALLEIVSPNSVVRGVGLRGAVDRGLVVRSSGAQLEGLEVVDCAVGVMIAEGGDSARVEGSRFTRNGTALAVSAGVSGTVVSENTFSRHDRAAIWAVAAAPLILGARRPLLVERNLFEDDRISVVLINVTGELASNRFVRSAEIAVLFTGDSVLRGNRLESGNAIGLLADAPDGALLEGNEVSGVGGVGIVVRGARNTELRGNQVYANGYGIVVVFGEPGLSTLLADNLVMGQAYDGVVVVGGSPVLRGNQILRNAAAGVRLLDHVPAEGPRRPALPTLEGNVLEANGSDEPQRGEYREPSRRP
jgi:parallel beta-helix repeat protein